MFGHPRSFIASSSFAVPPARGSWFVFRQRELLVTESFAIPSDTTPAELGLSPLRTQLLGELGPTPCFSAELAADVEPPSGMRFYDLLRLFGRVEPELLSLAGRAVQIMEWDRTHQFCGACGASTVPHPQARSRVCSRSECALAQYPRVAPAMIVAVERGPEILLARSPHFPPGIYSTLAGFVDPGESVEEAVHREVFEETGVRIENLRYFGSQAWPFPNSLMLGFFADYVRGELVLEEGEIEDAAFFHVDALPNMFPGRVSISQQLVADFVKRNARA
jgi:NAD+ diphosphatase